MSNSTESSESQLDGYLKRAYGLKSTDDARDLYQEWAASYDTDLTSAGYASPRRAVETLHQNLSLDQGEHMILDVGCGTGLVGDVLFEQASIKDHVQLDGLDLSQQMLDVAKEKKIYRKLVAASLLESVRMEDSVYDGIISVGTFTKGHVGPQGLLEPLRVLKEGGIMVVTVHKQSFEVEDYQTIISKLESTNTVKCISKNPFSIIQGSQREDAIMLVLKKI